MNNKKKKMSYGFQIKSTPTTNVVFQKSQYIRLSLFIIIYSELKSTAMCKLNYGPRSNPKSEFFKNVMKI